MGPLLFATGWRPSRGEGLCVGHHLSVQVIALTSALAYGILRTPMNSYSWTVLGLSIDIVGALLLSVKAINLDNLRKLRVSVLQKTYTRLDDKFHIGDAGVALFIFFLSTFSVVAFILMAAVLIARWMCLSLAREGVIANRARPPPPNAQRLGRS